MRHALSLVLLLFLSFTQFLMAEPKAGLEDYVRYVVDEAPHLDTSIVRLKSPKGHTLDLVSAVHLGDATYYQGLNERFRGYEVVLYEMVLPDEMAGQRLPSRMETGSGLSGFQGMLAAMMGLTAQLDQIDYSPENFVHADLTVNQLSRAMAVRQENFFTYLRNAMLSTDLSEEADLGISEQELADLDLMALFAGTAGEKDRRVLRKMFAHALSTSGSLMAGMNDSALISSRNVAALRALDRQLEEGRRGFALFYGAAHMPDLEGKMIRKGWTRTHHEWVEAWKI